MNDAKFLNTRPIGDIEERDVKKNTKFLNQLLANEYALFTKSLNFHWNVTGPRFHSLHNFLEEHYHKLLEIMDGVAERVRTLGEVPISTVSALTSEMEFSERNGDELSSNDMLLELYKNHIHTQNSIKEFVSEKESFRQDPGTEDYLIGLLQKHEMMSWMIKSHLTD